MQKKSPCATFLFLVFYDDHDSIYFIINMVSRVFMKLLRVDPDAANKAMTEEELRTIVDVSHEDGVIESDERK